MKNSDLLKQIVSVASITETIGEKKVEIFIRNIMNKFSYFEQNCDLYGQEVIPNDKYNRSINWGLVKGDSKETIIMINHHDVIGTDDYGILKKYAFNTDELFKHIIDSPGNEQLKSDLNTNDWMVGRGTADMKAGLVVQLDALQKYSEKQIRHVNLLFISVPDEENASLGMRYGSIFLHKLQKKYSLNYVLAINSEAHERKDCRYPTIYTGSAGKLMMCVHVKGKQAHLGEVLKGFNPLRLLSQIVTETDMNFDMADVGHSDIVPPPAWSYLRDNKDRYDASIPDSASGLLCFLSAKASADQIIYTVKQKIKKIVENNMVQDFDTVLFNYKNEGRVEEKIHTMLYSELLSEVESVCSSIKEDEKEKLLQAINEQYYSYFDATKQSIQRLLEYTSFEHPVVVLAIVPPYYPNVSSNTDSTYDEIISHLTQNTGIVVEPFYLGISDLSYITANKHNHDNVIENMPLWDYRIYNIPFDIIKSYNLKILNIGPWGKDFHQASERVYIPDVDKTIPRIIEELIEYYNSIYFNKK